MTQPVDQFPPNRLGNMSAKFDWRCFFGIHHWSKWSEEIEGVFKSYIGGEFSALIQQRHCANCQRIEVRKLLQ